MDRAGWKQPTKYLILNEPQGQFLEDLLLWYVRHASIVFDEPELAESVLRDVVRMNGGGSPRPAAGDRVQRAPLVDGVSRPRKRRMRLA